MAKINLTDVLLLEDRGTIESIISEANLSLSGKTIDDLSNRVGANHLQMICSNTTGVTIPAGTVVTKYSIQTSADYLDVVPVSNAQTEVALGIVSSDILNNEIGLVVTSGMLKNIIDTSLWSEGTLLYPTNTGGLTTTKPNSGQYQACALVMKSDPLYGTMLIDFTEPKLYGSTTQAGYLQLVNDLITNDTTKALTASQGKWLYDNLYAKIGQASGIAPLDGSSLIPAQYLPSYVDDVIEVATYSALPVTGEVGKIYVVIADETSGSNTSQYRWTGSVYAMVSNTLTATDILNLIKTVDGTGSGLDADTLDGLSSSAFEPADPTIIKDADIGVTVQAYDIDTTKNDVSNVFTLPQRTTISAGANALNFTLSNDLDFTATSANITVGTMATKKGQQGSITIRSAENITGWGAEFLFAPDFSAVTPTPPTAPTGTMEFWYKIVEVNGVDGGTANKIHIAWAK